MLSRIVATALLEQLRLVHDKARLAGIRKTHLRRAGSVSIAVDGDVDRGYCGDGERAGVAGGRADSGERRKRYRCG